MKNLFVLALAGLIMAACGNSTTELSGDLAELTALRDKLKATKDSLSTVLVEVEGKLMELDTNKKLTLVTLTKPMEGTFKHFFTVHGKLETDQMANINPEAQGKIDRISVKEGDRVTKGQTLAIINGDIIRKQIDELETQMELVQTVFERQEKLWKQNIGSEIQYLEAKSNRDALKKRLQTANEQLELTMVKAPFSGVIDEVFSKEGELASPGFPMFRLVNLDQLYIKADVSEAYLSKVKEGDSVIITLPNSDIAIANSTISRIGDFINPDNRTFKIKVDLKNNGNLLPNMLAEVKICDYQNDSTLILPEDIILQGAADSRYVFVAERADNGFARISKMDLTLGSTYRQKAEVLAGLRPDQEIVVKGARAIQEGELVQVIE